MADYRLPMDADGVKYHGTVDQNEENPGHFMYGLDENGNKRIIRTDEQGNVLTKVTGSRVDYQNIFERKIRTETEDVFTIVPDDAIGAIIQLSIHGITGNVSGGGLSLRVRNFATSKLFHSRTQISDMITDKQTSTFACNVIIYPIPSIAVNTYANNPPTVHDSILGDRLRVYCMVEGDFGTGEGIDCEGNIQWLKR